MLYIIVDESISSVRSLLIRVFLTVDTVNMAARTIIFRVIVAFVLTAVATPIWATSSWCGVTEKTSDGFVALRIGPSPKFQEVARVIPSDALTIDTGFCRSFMGKSYCDFSGKWVFVELITKLDGRSIVGGGWANSRYIRQVACDVP